MPKPNLILTGFMATGKTTVGKHLAGLLNYDFVDTDQLIESRSGQKIVDIFRLEGEALFRKMEADLARELAQKEGLVIATGGRMMLDPVNARQLGQKGRIFCLMATPGEILARVSADRGTTRPLLTGSDPMKRIMELMRERAEAYNRFPQVVTSGKTAAEVARMVLDSFLAPA